MIFCTQGLILNIQGNLKIQEFATYGFVCGKFLTVLSDSQVRAREREPLSSETH
jgi:hypothetical protein